MRRDVEPWVFLEGLGDLELAKIAKKAGWKKSGKEGWEMRLESSTG